MLLHKRLPNRKANRGRAMKKSVINGWHLSYDSIHGNVTIRDNGGRKVHTAKNLEDARMWCVSH